MKLTNKVIDKILSERQLRLKLALGLDKTEQAIRNNANRNNPNNLLTSVASLKILKAETSFSEKEIIESITA